MAAAKKKAPAPAPKNGSAIPPYAPKGAMPRGAMLGESGFARLELDSYWTQPWVTEALLDRVSFPRHVLEPAAGRGDMVEVLKARGYQVQARDVKDWGCPGVRVDDFLTTGPALPLPDVAFAGKRFAVVTNPPYAHAEAFIAKALELTEVAGGMVAMLLRNEFDSGQSDRGEGPRRALIADHPAFDAKLTLTRRPRWDWHLPAKKPGEERHGPQQRQSPRHNFAWLIWDWRRTVNRPPRLLYAP